MEKGGQKGAGEERRYTELEHPSHAVAAQPHFATSILPARLHSHSADPFTEGMSHMPLSSLFPHRIFHPLFQTPASPSPCCCCCLLLLLLLLVHHHHPSSSSLPRGSCLCQSRRFSFYLILPSIPLLYPSSPSLPPPPPPPLSRRSLSLSLSPSRSRLYSTKVSLFLPLFLCSMMRGGSGSAERNGEGGCTFCRISESRALLICRT